MVEQGRKAQPADPQAGNGTGEAGEAAEVTEVEKEEEVEEAKGAKEADEAEEKAEADQEPAQEEAAPVTVESLQEELAAAGDALLRAQAEAQNTRRRAEKDVEKARRFALERFSSELLSVVDNLERALQAAEQASGDAEAIDSKAIAEGVDLTLKGLLDVFGRFNISAVDPEGEPFDPQLHQAMSMLENSEVEPNTVLQVMQKGYTLNDRLIRPAMVIVSREPAQKEEKEEAGEQG